MAPLPVEDREVTEPTILYVDDQPSHLALFQKAFQGDYLVLTASNAEEGLEIIKEHDIFLVIADHNMPRMTGVDFLEKAKEISPNSLRAILSAYTNEKMIREADERVRLAGHLTKPWRLEVMRDFIEESYKQYEIGTPFGEGKEPSAVPDRKRPVSPREMASFVETLGEAVEPRGARRIFLKYVEPPLKNFVPTIRRPAPEILTMAQSEALKGDIEALQKILMNYLRQDRLADRSENPRSPLQ